MTALRADAEARSARLPDICASRRLAILDELRVPYDVAPGAPASSWASASAGGPAHALHWFVGDEGDAGGSWLQSTPIWGRLAPAAAAEAYARRLGGDWRPEAPIVDAAGVARAHVWRSPAGGTILPFDPDEVAATLRSERYRGLGSRRPSPTAAARRGYYALRPLLPRPLQIWLRRGFARVQRRTAFPRWPVEPALHDLVDFVLARLADACGAPVPHLAPWPHGRSWALVLTHDVETARGRDAIERVRGVEVAAGFRSSWNLVPERYAVDDALIAHLRAAGCEVGVHGLRHDGRDFESLRTLRRRLPEMRRWAERWGAVGFRAPATHRVWEWMPLLGFDYDSSYPDTDPYEPMAGGCCSWLPFFNADMVELPITLPQDHTLFVILRRDESLWREKAELLRAREGMASLIVHPDYMLDDVRLAAYERFLCAFRADPTMWAALPREIAAWWRRRAATSLQRGGDGWMPAGPAQDEAAVRYAEPGRWPIV
jgi:hypothetical protein